MYQSSKFQSSIINTPVTARNYGRVGVGRMLHTGMEVGARRGRSSGRARRQRRGSRKEKKNCTHDGPIDGDGKVRHGQRRWFNAWARSAASRSRAVVDRLGKLVEETTSAQRLKFCEFQIIAAGEKKLRCYCLAAHQLKYIGIG
jgi:hypothetical protein